MLLEPEIEVLVLWEPCFRDSSAWGTQKSNNWERWLPNAYLEWAHRPHSVQELWASLGAHINGARNSWLTLGFEWIKFEFRLDTFVLTHLLTPTGTSFHPVVFRGKCLPSAVNVPSSPEGIVKDVGGRSKNMLGGLVSRPPKWEQIASIIKQRA